MGELLRVGAMVVATVAPTARDRWEAQAEGRILQFDEETGLNALNRCAKWGFARTEPPKWLHSAISSLRMLPADFTCEMSKAKRNAECYTRIKLFEENLATTQLDHIVTHSLDLRELVCRLY